MPSKKFKSPKILDAGAAQHKEHEKPIWKAVKAGNVDEVLRLCDEDIGVLNKRDPEGAAPIHIAFLYQKNEVGKALVTRYPECALHQYDRRLCNPPAAPGPYAGENILHIAIVHRDFELVEWLLDREPRLLEAEAIGSFFEPGQGTYFGGYPLLFAVASNQFDVVEVILNLKLPPIADDEKAERLERMKSIWLADKYGNTALHLCVVHELEEMYQFCLQKAEEKVHQRAACESKQPLKDQPNAEQLTPLALAAAMGKTSMFNFILEQSIYPAWVYGPVTAKMMPLVGLEQPIVNDDGKVTDAKTALECLISGHSRVTKCLPLDSHGQIDADVYAGRLEIVMLEQVKQLIDKKWQFFGRPEFRRKLRNFLVLQITWTVASVIPNEGQVGKIISIALEVVVGLLVLWKLKSEIQEILVKGIEYFAELRRASAFDNACSLPFNLLYVTGFILRRLSELTEFEGLIPWEDACFGCAALVGWMTMFFFLLGMRTTGPFVIMIREMISNDMYRFGTVYISVLMGFTMSMYMVLGREYNDIRAFFMHMDEFILLGTAGELPASMDDWQGKTNEWYAHALLIAYILFVVVLLLNLLIAMMGSTYSKVDEVYPGSPLSDRPPPSILVVCLERALTRF